MRSVNGFTGRNTACCKPLFCYVQKFQKKNWEETFWMVRHGHSFFLVFFVAPYKSRGGIFVRCYRNITGTTGQEASGSPNCFFEFRRFKKKPHRPAFVEKVRENTS